MSGNKYCATLKHGSVEPCFGDRFSKFSFPSPSPSWPPAPNFSGQLVADLIACSTLRNMSGNRDRDWRADVDEREALAQAEEDARLGLSPTDDELSEALGDTAV